MRFYYRNLSMGLRRQRVPESRIAEVLRDVDEFCRESRQTPEQQFGPAAAYAKTFPAAGGHRAPRNGLLVVLGVIALALAYVVYRWQVIYDSVSYVGRAPVVFLLVMAQLVTIALIFASNYRLPKGFDLTSDRSA